jgi:hypothetical protein
MSDTITAAVTWFNDLLRDTDPKRMEVILWMAAVVAVMADAQQRDDGTVRVTPEEIAAQAKAKHDGDQPFNDANGLRNAVGALSWLIAHGWLEKAAEAHTYRIANPIDSFARKQNVRSIVAEAMAKAKAV